MHVKLLNQSLSCNVDRKESNSERNKNPKKSLVVCDESTISTCSTFINTVPCSDDPDEGAFSNVSKSYLKLLETSKAKHASDREVFNTKENDQLFFPDSSVLNLLAIRRKVTRSLERQDQKSGNNGRSRLFLKSLPEMFIWIPNPASCNNIENLDPLKTGNRFIPVKSISSANKDHDMDLFRRREYHYGSTYACDDCTDSYPYVLCRRSLVDWMSVVGDKLGILPGTVHLAVMYVDKVLSCRLRVSRIPSSRYKILAAACISLAIKYDEVSKDYK
jgi:Cyclin, N-terminal domain